MGYENPFFIEVLKLVMVWWVEKVIQKLVKPEMVWKPRKPEVVRKPVFDTWKLEVILKPKSQKWFENLSRSLKAWGDPKSRSLRTDQN